MEATAIHSQIWFRDQQATDGRWIPGMISLDPQFVQREAEAIQVGLPFADVRIQEARYDVATERFIPSSPR